MLGEYKVSRCTRKCYALQRPLREGEWYYSVVLEAGDAGSEAFERRDYAAESWQGPPEGAVGWWKSRIPRADEKKLVLAPPEVLIDLVRQMEQFPQRAKSRYLLTLMLMRKRLLRPVDSADDSNPVPDDTLRVEVVADGSTIDVPTCKISRSESDLLSEQLNELLYCEAEPEPDADEVDD